MNATIAPQRSAIDRVRSTMQASIEKLLLALTDPSRQNRVMLAVLGCYTAVWTLYGVIQKSSQDINADVAELFLWSRKLESGYWKHPPLGAYVVRAWTTIFPAEDWSLYLLGITNAAVTLWIIWSLSASYLNEQKRVIGIALLTFVPFFNFRALVYDHNQLLMPFWALTTMYFLRAFERRQQRDAVLTGFFAGLSVLGKYWSADLLAGLGIAALLDSRRAAFFRSWAPFIAVAVASVVIVPNLVWEYQHGFPTLRYAFNRHPADTIVSGLASSVLSIVKVLLQAGIPLLVVAIAAKPSRAYVHDLLRPRGGHQRLAVASFWAPIGLSLVLAIWGISFNSLWAIPGLALFPIVLLASPAVTLSKEAFITIVGSAIVFPFLALLASPVVSVAILLGPVRENSHTRLLADQIELAWREVSMRPLPTIIAPTGLALGLSFYLPSHPDANPRDISRPWNGAYPPIDLDNEKISREGFIVACERTQCAAMIIGNLPSGISRKTSDFSFVRQWLCLHGRPGDYSAMFFLPKS
jgi:4-amino-4-deoxy-L-arabinose transferase-like glycosyltransferase